MKINIKQKTNYGIDGPGFVKTVGFIGSICILISITSSVFKDNFNPVLYRIFFILSLILGCYFLLTVIIMIISSKIGKPFTCRRLIRSLNIQENEAVLDVGCGRGILLIEAAKYLKTGKAVGVDLWMTRDQSGNSIEATLLNAKIENVDKKIDLKTGDIQSLPVESESIDVVVSSLAIHNISSVEGKCKAIQEISRVLKHDGRIALMDLAHSKEYIKTLKELGWTDIERSKPLFTICPPVRIVKGTKP